MKQNDHLLTTFYWRSHDSPLHNTHRSIECTFLFALFDAAFYSLSMNIYYACKVFLSAGPTIHLTQTWSTRPRHIDDLNDNRMVNQWVGIATGNPIRSLNMCVGSLLCQCQWLHAQQTRATVAGYCIVLICVCACVIWMTHYKRFNLNLISHLSTAAGRL